MKYFFMVLTIVFSLCVLGLAMYINPEDIDPKNYCGPRPYPESIPHIPRINSEARASKLKQISHYVFFRHGDRATLSPQCFSGISGFNRIWSECPDPILNHHQGLKFRIGDQEDKIGFPIPVATLKNKGLLSGNCHVGQLTDKGLMASYNNGNRVGNYLNQTYPKHITPKMLQTRSTDVHRTRQTLHGFYAGVLDTLALSEAPPTSFSPIKNSPVLTHVEASVDALQLNENVCNAKEYLKKAYDDPKYIEYNEKVFAPLEKAVQTLLHSTMDMYSIYDCMKTSYCHSIPVPLGLEDYHTQLEAALLNYWGHAYNYDPKLSSILYSGAFMVEFLPLIKAATSPTPPTEEIFLFAGHDTTMQFLLHTFQLTDSRGFKDAWPSYSSLINLELYKNGEEDAYFVRFVYDAHVVIPSWCKPIFGDFCPLQGLIERMSAALPLNGECPRIPRQSIETLERVMKTEQHGSPATISDENIRNFIQSMKSIHQEQDIQEIEEQQRIADLNHSDLFHHLTSRY